MTAGEEEEGQTGQREGGWGAVNAQENRVGDDGTGE